MDPIKNTRHILLITFQKIKFRLRAFSFLTVSLALFVWLKSTGNARHLCGLFLMFHRLDVQDLLDPILLNFLHMREIAFYIRQLRHAVCPKHLVDTLKQSVIILPRHIHDFTAFFFVDLVTVFFSEGLQHSCAHIGLDLVIGALQELAKHLDVCAFLFVDIQLSILFKKFRRFFFQQSLIMVVVAIQPLVNGRCSLPVWCAVLVSHHIKQVSSQCVYLCCKAGVFVFPPGNITGQLCRLVKIPCSDLFFDVCNLGFLFLLFGFLVQLFNIPVKAFLQGRQLRYPILVCSFQHLHDRILSITLLHTGAVLNVSQCVLDVVPFQPLPVYPNIPDSAQSLRRLFTLDPFAHFPKHIEGLVLDPLFLVVQALADFSFFRIILLDQLQFCSIPILVDPLISLFQPVLLFGLVGRQFFIQDSNSTFISGNRSVKLSQPVSL